MSERRVGQGVERLLQLVELARDEREAVLALGRAIEAFELVGDPVEAFEERVELAVSHVVLFHGREFYVRRRRSSRVRTIAAPVPITASSRSSAPAPVSSASMRLVAPR